MIRWPAALPALLIRCRQGWRQRVVLRRSALTLLALTIVLTSLRLLPKPELGASIPTSSAIYARHGELLRLTTARDQQYRVPVALDAIAPALPEAVLLYEDRWFHWHPGVNPAALLRAAFTTLNGNSRQGGSTITMQLARRLYGIDSRTPSGKLRQIALALWLEARYSKRAILNAYLNLAPYGGNIEGVAAASLIYFHKRAADLNVPEALALAVIPQNPNKRLAASRNAPAGDPAASLMAARQRLWAAWQHRHPQDQRYAAEFSLPLKPWSVAQLPFRAPHFSDQLLRLNSGGGEIRSSLDLAMQSTVERMLARYLDGQHPLGIRNAAALLVDASTMEVRALVGSANFHDAAISGQVNGMLAKRSPGSTLKPFIYGLALDQGILHPKTVLRDAPTAFGPFSPENFDGRFVGPISVEEALIRSRNIPAVSVSAKLSRPNLYDFLKQAGVSRLQAESHYGLALALGGGDASGEELAKLYALLANGGVLQEIRNLPNTERPSPPTRLLSPEAAFIVLDMLRRNPRPDTFAPASPPIAWKTGTSWGFRDAWTVGVFGRHVLIVWVGNFDSSPNPALVGVRMAAPLFMQIVDSLRAQNLDPDSRQLILPPAGVSKVEICTASGDLPNQHCPEKSLTWFIPGKSPIKISTLHRAILVDSRGQATCTPGPDTQEQVFEFWSSEMQKLFREAGIPRRQPPRLPDCAAGNASAESSDAPRITSPLRGLSYTLRPNKPVAIALRADKASGAGKLFWFADRAFIGISQQGEALAWNPPAAGRFGLRVVDELGRTDHREVIIETTD